MKRKTEHLTLLPVFALLVGLGLFPLIFTFIMSFQRINLKTPWLNQFFVGFENYIQLWGNPQFLKAVSNTLIFVFVTLFLEIVMGFLFAYLLYRALMTKNYITQIALFLPLSTPAVLSGQMWRLFFHDGEGIANQVLTSWGIIAKGIPWLSEPLLAWMAIGMAEVWKLTPFVVLIFISGLLKIPKEVWEAAAIDGAGSFARVRYIAIPMLRSTFFVILVFRALDGIRVFDLVYVLTQGGPGGMTDVLGLYIYRTLFGDLTLGKGCAASISLFFIAVSMVLVIVFLFRKGRFKDD